MDQSQNVLADMKERLNYVLSTKETAVQQTLALTEESLALVDTLRAVLQSVADSNIEVFSQSAAMLDDMQQRLTNILMTQGYQDLTGQVLKRVMEELDMVADVSIKHATPKTVNGSEGFGPAALSSEKAGRAASQDDVDDLLAQMGL
jgi:chemotaxis protein CheZ